MRSFIAVIMLLTLAYAKDDTHTGSSAPAHTMQHHQEMLEAQAPLALSKEMLNLMHEPMMEKPFLEDDNLDLIQFQKFHTHKIHKVCTPQNPTAKALAFHPKKCYYPINF